MGIVRERLGLAEDAPLALFSVFHKEGIVEYARELQARGHGIVASGGTARTLREAGIVMVPVEDITGMGAILDHQVVTLHPAIHGGLLAKYDNEGHLEELKKQGWDVINVVVCDPYPVELEIKANAGDEKVTDLEDIGGPTMISAGAKRKRAVLITPEDRQEYLEHFDNDTLDDGYFRWNHAKADAYVAAYRLLTARYFGNGRISGMVGVAVEDCLYGENKNEQSVLFSCGSDDPLGADKYVRVAGTERSHINITDLDRAAKTLCHAAEAFRRAGVKKSDKMCIAIAVKHGRACGAAYGTDPIKVLKDMIVGDREAIMGALVLVNFAFSEEEAQTLIGWKNVRGQKRRLIDCLVAPSITDGAVEVMRRHGDKCRFVTNPALEDWNKLVMETEEQIRPLRGNCFLGSTPKRLVPDPTSPEFLKCGRPLSDAEELDLLFAWAICSTTESNTVTLVQRKKLIANAGGRQKRVDACWLAVELAKRCGHFGFRGAAAWSDSFFPVEDGPTILVGNGISVIGTTSGSLHADEAVVGMCKRARVKLIMIPDKDARAFSFH